MRSGAEKAPSHIRRRWRPADRRRDGWSVAELAHHALRFRTIVLVESARVLSAFPERLGRHAAQALGRLGVEVRLGRPVTAPATRCDAAGVTIDLKRIEARTIVWAAVVIASPVAAWIGAPTDRAGRIVVAPDLSVTGHEAIFAIGGTASLHGPDGRRMPGIAPAAKQMGQYVSTLIDRRVPRPTDAAAVPLPKSGQSRHHG